MANTIDQSFIRRRVLTIIAFIVGLAYLIYCASYWAPVLMNDGLVGGLAFQLVLPHIICTVVATVFCALALFLGKPWWDLAAGILYTVAIILFPAYWVFVVIPAIFSFLGFARMYRQQRDEATNPAVVEADQAKLDAKAAQSAADDGIHAPADEKDSADDQQSA